jgi:hypothetical protein
MLADLRDALRQLAGGPSFDLARITTTVGAPFLRLFGEGRESVMPVSSGFNRVSTTKSDSTRSITLRDNVPGSRRELSCRDLD